MLFSSVTFIFYFLPVLIGVYFIMPTRYKNGTLLIFSLLFYFLSEPKYIVVLLLSCFINYILGKCIYTGNSKKIWLVVAVIYNIGQLVIFKYTDFFIKNVNDLFGLGINLLNIIMPIGISFFTFQALGYIIDVYNGEHKPAEKLLDFMMYISLFPQLVAGPIVRYRDVKEQLTNRTTSFEKFGVGIRRFVIGLSKKVLIANVLGEIIGEITSDVVAHSVLGSWMTAILFTLQIYFDFSGYSDMAIGLGSMFGFSFMENFNYPLTASSITDFWRRWHISLSVWFRDYVYIPLGGNRVNKIKFIRNILIVWFLTGFWHGAEWNFIIWGLYYGFWLLIEKMFLQKILSKLKGIRHIYTVIIVVISFLIFSTENLGEILVNLGNMLFINGVPFVSSEVLYHLKSNWLLIFISIIGATPLARNLVIKFRKGTLDKVVDFAEIIWVIGLLVLCTAFLIDASFNPFLYFRF